jgi:hypothetical protein
MNIMKRILISMSLCLGLLSFSAGSMELVAQSYADVPGISLGRATVASSRGVDALVSNPANLAFADTNTTFSFTIPALTFGTLAGTDVMTLEDFNYYFGGAEGNSDEGRVLTGSERTTLFSLLNNSTVAAQIDALAFAATLNTQVGNFGFALTANVHGKLILPNGFEQLGSGYDGKNSLSLNDGAFQAFGYSTVQFSYANMFINSSTKEPGLVSLAGGASVKYVLGAFYEEIEDGSAVNINPFVPTGFQDTYNWEVQTRYTYRSSGGNFIDDNRDTELGANGNGFGIDLGATAQIRLGNEEQPALAVGFSLMDLGVISWSDGRVRTVDVVDTVTSLVNVADEDDYFRRFQDTTSGEKESFTLAMPARMRLGAMLDIESYTGIPLPLRVMLEYTQGLNTVGVNTTSPRVGFGVELANTGFIPVLRTGIQVGGLEGFQWAFGFGWDTQAFGIDISVNSLSSLLAVSETSYVGGGLRMRVSL